MTFSKIVYPSSIFLNFYYYYTYLTLFLCLLIAPLQFYTILTQSKTLGAFKWLILNHSFWCLAFQIFFTTVKPLFLFPAVAGFPIGFGFSENGNYQTTFVGFFVGFILAINTASSLIAAVFNRYLVAFPSRITKWFTFKVGTLIMLAISLITYTVPTIMIWPIIKLERNEMLQLAFDHNPSLSVYFENPLFCFLPFEAAKNGYFFVFCLLSFMIFVGFCIICLFTFLVHSSNTQIIARIHRSLIISATVELAISNLFGLIPCTIFTAFLGFQIPYTADWGCILFCLLTTHFFLQSVIALYFIIPYRTFICKLFSRILSR